MLVLHGFSSSNYHNVVKLALLEKQLPFEEALVYPGAGERYRPDYLEQRMEQRPTVQRVRADQAEDRPKFFAHIKQVFG